MRFDKIPKVFNDERKHHFHRGKYRREDNKFYRDGFKNPLDDLGNKGLHHAHDQASMTMRKATNDQMQIMIAFR